MPRQSVCQLIASTCTGDNPDLSEISRVVSGSPRECLARILSSNGQKASNLSQYFAIDLVCYLHPGESILSVSPMHLLLSELIPRSARFDGAKTPHLSALSLLHALVYSSLSRLRTSEAGGFGHLDPPLPRLSPD